MSKLKIAFALMAVFVILAAPAYPSGGGTDDGEFDDNRVPGIDGGYDRKAGET